MAAEIPEQVVVGANPPPASSSPSPPVPDRTIMGSSDIAEVSADTSAAVCDVNWKGVPPPCEFQIGETVLAWYGQHLYEAKILKADYGPCWRVHVHYKGWKNTYNEWLLLDKLLKNTEENRKIKADLDLDLKLRMEKGARSIGTGSRGRKRKTETAQMDQPSSSGKITVSSSLGETSSPAKRIPTSSQSPPLKMIPTPSQDSTIPTPSKENIIPIPSKEITAAPSLSSQKKFKYIRIPIATSLRKILTDDWLLINQSDKLVKLPRSPTVDEILTKYEELRVKKEPRRAAKIGTIVDGVKDYFNQALPQLLLYRSEFPQQEEFLANNVVPSSVYGAEHLLRLFIKLPDLLDLADIEDDTIAECQQQFMDMLKYLQKNQSSFCLPPHQYVEAPATSEKQE